jgi:FdhE protein
MSGSPDRLLLLERRVAALGKNRPDLADALSLQHLIIRIVLSTARAPRAEPFALPREQAAARVRTGVPLLHDQPLTLDIPYASDVFSRLVDAFIERDESGEGIGADLEALVAAAKVGLIDPQHLFTEAFVQHTDHLAQIATAAGVDAYVLAAVTTQAVVPLLRAYAERLLPVLERLDDGTMERAVWDAGYCPICGAWPLLGELRGVELALWLRCSACGSGWRWQRLACAYCGNDDYHTLGTLAIEGEQRFRISVCERCMGFLKVGNAFDPPPAELVPLDDAASMHLDLAAVDRGYKRPPGSGFRIELATPEAEWLEELE